MKLDRDSKVYTIIFTFVSSFLFLIILSGLNILTAQQVKKNQQLFTIRAVLNAMGISYTNDEEAIKIFNSQVRSEEKDSYRIFSANVNGEKVYAILFTGSGLWGNISGVLAVNNDVSRIVGIDFISQNETPGLGGRIEEDWFKSQFRNESIINDKVIVSTTKVSDSKDDGQVDAITGATLTSKSIEKIIAVYVPIIKELVGVK